MKLITFLVTFLVFFVTTAQAQTAVTRYVDTDCANDGNGTADSCAASAGAAGAWNKMSTAEAENEDLVTADEQWTIYFKGTAKDTTKTTWGGWTTDFSAGQYPILKPNSSCEHDGVLDDDCYIYSNAETNSFLVLDMSMVVDGLQFESTDSTSNGVVTVFSGDTGTDEIHFLNNIIRETSGTPGRIGFNFDMDGGSNKTVVAVNNIIYDVNIAFDIYLGASSESVIYNNTYVNLNSWGLLVEATGSGSNHYIKNNICDDQGASNDCYANFASGVTESDNYCSDATCPANSTDSATFTFENAASDNYALASGDSSGAKTGGADLSSDAQYSFSTDIDGVSRSDWSAGAHEFVSASSSGSAIHHESSLQPLSPLGGL